MYLIHLTMPQWHWSLLLGNVCYQVISGSRLLAAFDNWWLLDVLMHAISLHAIIHHTHIYTSMF
jgi:hypothetical protein